MSSIKNHRHSLLGEVGGPCPWDTCAKVCAMPGSDLTQTWDGLAGLHMAWL